MNYPIGSVEELLASISNHDKKVRTAAGAMQMLQEEVRKLGMKVEIMEQARDLAVDKAKRLAFRLGFFEEELKAICSSDKIESLEKKTAEAWARMEEMS